MGGVSPPFWGVRVVGDNPLLPTQGWWLLGDALGGPAALSPSVGRMKVWGGSLECRGDLGVQREDFGVPPISGGAWEAEDTP